MWPLKRYGLTAAQQKQDYQKVLEYARTCRVENIMRPYLEAVM